MSLLNEWVAGVWNVFCIHDSDFPELWSVVFFFFFFNIVSVQNENLLDAVLVEQPVMVLQH